MRAGTRPPTRGQPTRGPTARRVPRRGHGGAHRDGARHRRTRARRRAARYGLARLRAARYAGWRICHRPFPHASWFPSTTEIRFLGPFFTRHREKGAGGAEKRGCYRGPAKVSVLPPSCRCPCRLSRLLVGGPARHDRRLRRGPIGDHQDLLPCRLGSWVLAITNSDSLHRPLTRASAPIADYFGFSRGTRYLGNCAQTL